MTAVNFPNPTETNPDTGLPYSAGWYNDANGVTYEFTNGIWSATKTPGADFNNTFVLKAGDTMSGPLAIGPFASDGDSKLHLVTGPTGGDTGYIYFGESVSEGAIYYPAAGNHFMGFQTEGYRKLRITRDGYVGINESNPTHELHVKGEIYGTGPAEFADKVTCRGAGGITTQASSGQPYAGIYQGNVGISNNGGNFAFGVFDRDQGGLQPLNSRQMDQLNSKATSQ